MRNNLKILMGVIFFAFIIYGCEKEYITTNAGTSGTGKDTVSFKSDIVPIFKAHCLLCHFAGGQTPNFAPNPYQTITTGGYVNTASPEASRIYVKLSDPKSDHVGRSTAAEQQLILKWIQQGAKNN